MCERGDKSKEGGWISVDRKASLLSYLQSLVPCKWSAKDLSQLQFGDDGNVACIIQTWEAALGVVLWFPYATGGRRVPALILT